MCRFKSFITLKNKVVLAPTYNDSHSALLRKLGIEDDHFNASKVFVKGELVPPNNDMTAEVSEWKYIVDQDIVPDWYEADPKRYEDEARAAVKEWTDKHLEVVLGKSCSKIKVDGDYTYHFLNEILFRSDYGENNNYAESKVRQELVESDFAKALKEEYGDKLVPLTIDLTSLDGLKDYGKVEGDLIGIPPLDLYRECRENIINLDSAFWTSTPDSTPSCGGSGCVQFVGVDGYVFCDWYDFVIGVRPFWITKS